MTLRPAQVRMRPRGRVTAALVGALALLAALMAPAGAYYQPPGTTARVSVASDGSEANDRSNYPTISADGRFVAFTSAASNLVPGDTNGYHDVFVHDRETGTTERVSVASDGTQANGDSGWLQTTRPEISADGRYVAFASYASNLVPGDTNGAADIFVHDRQTGATERVSVASDGTQGNGDSGYASMSADGRYVSFSSDADNLVAGDTNGIRDFFVHDRQTGTTERVSVASDGTQGIGELGGFRSAISADGRYVAFSTYAFNLVPGDTNRWADVFVHDRETGTTERVSVASDGTEQNGDAPGFPSLSADGRYVAFYSWASNLVPSDTQGCGVGGAFSCRDVYVHDRETGATERVSVASDGTEGIGDSLVFPNALSADGRYVAFEGWAGNLVPDDTNNAADVFVHDRETGVTERVSVASDGSEGNGRVGWNAMSADARYVAFWSRASNLVPGDTNGAEDVFVRDRGPAIGVGGLAAQQASGEVVASGWATFSGVSLASATDPPDDGVDELGAEITGASVVYQPGQEALLLRLRLASLPALHGPSSWVIVQGFAGVGRGVPTVLYRFGFVLEGTSYEVRAVRDLSADAPPAASRFSLYECAPACTESTALSGGIGTTGAEMRVSVPLAALGAGEGAELTDIEASAALGEAAPGPLVVLDDVVLPDASIPVPRVELAIVPASAPQAEVVFSTQAELVEGRFSGSLDVSSLPPGAHRVWARACLGQTCGAEWVDVVR